MQRSGYIKGQDDGADIGIRIEHDQITVTLQAAVYTAKALPLKHISESYTIKTRPEFIGTHLSIKEFTSFLADPVFSLWTTAMLRVILQYGKEV